MLPSPCEALRNPLQETYSLPVITQQELAPHKNCLGVLPKTSNLMLGATVIFLKKLKNCVCVGCFDATARITCSNK